MTRKKLDCFAVRVYIIRVQTSRDQSGRIVENREWIAHKRSVRRVFILKQSIKTIDSFGVQCLWKRCFRHIHSRRRWTINRFSFPATCPSNIVCFFAVFRPIVRYAVYVVTCINPIPCIDEIKYVHPTRRHITPEYTRWYLIPLGTGRVVRSIFDGV